MLRHRIKRLIRALCAWAQWRWRRADLGISRSRAESRFGTGLKLWDEPSYFPQHEYLRREPSLMIAFRNEMAAMIWVASDLQIPADARKPLFEALAAGHTWTDLPSPDYLSLCLRGRCSRQSILGAQRPTGMGMRRDKWCWYGRPRISFGFHLLDLAGVQGNSVWFVVPQDRTSRQLTMR